MSGDAIETQAAACATWPEHLGPNQWQLYKSVIEAALHRNVRFAVGGGLAAMTYAGQWRNSKDLDLYLQKRDLDQMKRILVDLAFRDYYEKLAYDREWIYRAYSDDIIIDLIFAMANQRTQVDDQWFDGPEVEADGVRFRLIAPEEALWSKLYVLQRDRSDWPDTLNLLYGVGPEMDFRRILRKLSSDAPLLAGLLRVFGWLCPSRARELPEWLWDELGLRPPEDLETPEQVSARARLLDTRPWFTPTLSSNP